MWRLQPRELITLAYGYLAARDCTKYYQKQLCVVPSTGPSSRFVSFASDIISVFSLRLRARSSRAIAGLRV